VVGLAGGRGKQMVVHSSAILRIIMLLLLTLLYLRCIERKEMMPSGAGFVVLMSFCSFFENFSRCSQQERRGAGTKNREFPRWGLM
jgi:hypothetical protein